MSCRFQESRALEAHPDLRYVRMCVNQTDRPLGDNDALGEGESKRCDSCAGGFVNVFTRAFTRAFIGELTGMRAGVFTTTFTR